MPTLTRPLTAAESTVVLNETVPSIMVEQEGLPPEMQDYLRDFVKKFPAFSLDKKINRNDVIFELRRAWPKLPGRAIEEKRILEYFNQVVHTLPPAGPSTSCAIRIWVVTPQKPTASMHLPQPDETVVIAPFNSIEGTLHRFVFPAAEELPAFDTLNINSGLMVLCQSLPPLTNQFVDSRGTKMGAGNLYSERTQDKLLSGDDPDPKANFMQTAPLPPLPLMQQHPFVPRPSLEEEEQFAGGSRREDLLGGPLAHATEAALLAAALERHHAQEKQKRIEEEQRKQQELQNKNGELIEMRDQEASERIAIAQRIDAAAQEEHLPVAEAAEIAALAEETMRAQSEVTSPETSSDEFPSEPERPDLATLSEEFTQEAAEAEGMPTEAIGGPRTGIENPEAPEEALLKPEATNLGETPTQEALAAEQSPNTTEASTPATESVAEGRAENNIQAAEGPVGAEQQQNSEGGTPENQRTRAAENNLEASEPSHGGVSSEAAAQNEPREAAGQQRDTEPTPTGPSSGAERVEALRAETVAHHTPQPQETHVSAEEMKSRIDHIKEQLGDGKELQKNHTEFAHHISSSNYPPKGAEGHHIERTAGDHFTRRGEEVHKIREEAHNVHTTNRGDIGEHRESSLPREARDYHSMDRELHAVQQNGMGGSPVHHMAHHLLHDDRQQSSLTPSTPLHTSGSPPVLSSTGRNFSPPLATPPPTLNPFWSKTPLRGIIPYLAAGLIGATKKSPRPQDARPVTAVTKEELRAQEWEKQKKKLQASQQQESAEKKEVKDQPIEAPPADDLTPSP